MALDKKARARVIGGSESAAALGVDEFKSRSKLYDLKEGLAVDDDENADMRRGKLLEPTAVEEYVARTGARVRRMKHRVHSKHDFIGCTVDRQHLAVDDTITDVQLRSVIGMGSGVLEVKCPRMRTLSKYRYEGLPSRIIIQMQHSLAVTGYKWGVFVLFNAENWELIHFVVMRDDALIEQIIRGVTDFVENYWKKGVRPPEIEDVKDIDVMAIAGEAEIRHDEKWLRAAAAFLEAVDLEKTDKRLKEEARDILFELAGDSECSQGGGVRYALQQGRLSFNKEKFASKHPKINLSDFSERGEPIKSVKPIKSRG